VFRDRVAARQQSEVGIASVGQVAANISCRGESRTQGRVASTIQSGPPQPKTTRGYSARCNPVFVGGCAGVASGGVAEPIPGRRFRPRPSDARCASLREASRAGRHGPATAGELARYCWRSPGVEKQPSSERQPRRRGLAAGTIRNRSRRAATPSARETMTAPSSSPGSWRSHSTNRWQPFHQALGHLRHLVQEWPPTGDRRRRTRRTSNRTRKRRRENL
jgi:hypothetical protein